MSTDPRIMDVETSGELTVVRFRWPGNKASSDLAVIDQLDEFFEREHERPSKVIALVAPPEVTAAANLELRDPNEEDPSGPRLVDRMSRRENMMVRMVSAIRESRAFVVGVVDGDVALRMASPLLACDYRIAGETATFRYTSRDLPLAPTGGALWTLSRLIGRTRTVDLVIDGQPLTAREARQLGLLNFVTSANDVEAEALAQCRRLARLQFDTLRQLKHGLLSACEPIEAYTYLERKLLLQGASATFGERGRR